MDFLQVSTRVVKGTVEIYPKFIVCTPSDLMIRGRDFYAVWVEDRKLWSTSEDDVNRLIDRELDIFAKENSSRFPDGYRILHMWDGDTGMVDKWHRYCQKQLRDNYHNLDDRLIFADTETTKEDYASKRLPYAMKAGSIEAYDKLMSVLYSPEERQKIEWGIGSIISGDSAKNQKFIVMYGAAGTGKSTVLNIIQKLFEGYYSTFDAKALGSNNSEFALEAFKTNPLVAIQHDGDLSRIEDNTRLNSLVSHEQMTVNEKYKGLYASEFRSFLFMGTNRAVKITDAKSGLLRRLIDVSPTGDTIPAAEYRRLMKHINFELGAIADHCLKVYQDNKHFYDSYVPVAMMGASNDFYNFVAESFTRFKRDDSTTLKAAWSMYKEYAEDANFSYTTNQRTFKEELKNYFKEYYERYTLDDGTRVRSYYKGFIFDKFEGQDEEKTDEKIYVIEFKEQHSLLDDFLMSCPAQYATRKTEAPIKRWADVTTTLADIDTSRLHYVKVPSSLITVDFDIPGEDGQKNLEANIREASKWPKTYAELSKSGKAVHLSYIYEGDPTKLSAVYDDHIEIKVMTGDSSLRRKLTKCNDIPIATISSGLPLKGETKVINKSVVQTEKGIRTMIKRNLNREIHPNTKPSVDFIFKILQDAYESGLVYDVSDMRNAILVFAASSTHQSEACVKTVSKMKFKSDDIPDDSTKEETHSTDDIPIVFFDSEVFPNLVPLNWKFAGEGVPIVRWINPTPTQIEELMQYRLIGFNNRNYDNHIMYGILLGYSISQIYDLSQRIVSGKNSGKFRDAYDISYADVYDFCSKKQSLKKWEIELGIHHKELGLPWDEPVPEDKWEMVAEYCDNDVLATEAVFNARQGDFTARKILAEIAGGKVNDKTNTLSARFIFGNEQNPQKEFNYRDLSGGLPDGDYDEWNLTDEDRRRIFPGYFYNAAKKESTYRGEVVGEGGYSYVVEGVYTNVYLLDIASMHPSTIIAEELFGPNYTARFKEILDTRLAIKHKDFDKARGMLDGKLVKYLSDESTAKDLAQALKIVINSVYGLTFAKFPNKFRDDRNIDNIVAKRGALFMINLKNEMQKRGWPIAHIKVDSIKVPNPTQEMLDFIMDYGKTYGYSFEQEAIYSKLCIVNKSTYIAKEKDGDWTATATQFQVPYVFKTLFSHEPITFDDKCETKSVQTAMYLDMDENLPDDEHNYIFVGKVGRFCPVKPGCGGGRLVAKRGEKYDGVTGTVDYRWKEAETIRALNLEDQIDLSYYAKLVDAAKTDISKYCDFEWFVSDELDDDLPF